MLYEVITKTPGGLALASEALRPPPLCGAWRLSSLERVITSYSIHYTKLYELIFLFLILVVRPVVLALIKPRVAEEEVEELVSLPEAEERLALEEGIEEEALDLQRRLENAKAQALQLSEQDMDQAVAVLKSWLKQEGV